MPEDATRLPALSRRTVVIRTPLLAALTLLVAAPSLPQPAGHSVAVGHSEPYRAIEAIRWTYDDENSRNALSTRQLRFSHGHSNSSVSPDRDPEVQRIVATLAQAAPGRPLSFALTREAGTIACTGRAERGGGGSGTCRFDPDQSFAAALSDRGIAAEDSEQILALSLVGAHLATADGLAAQGFRLGGTGDLIAVSALGVTPAYAGELRAAGLKIHEMGDLIAARALKIDASWLGAMAGAGYPNLEVGKAIQMRALGVTPDYAMKMARVLRQVGEIQ